MTTDLRALGLRTGTHLAGFRGEWSRPEHNKTSCGMLIVYVKLAGKDSEPTCVECARAGV